MKFKNIKLLKNKKSFKGIIFASVLTTLTGCGSYVYEENKNPYEGEPIAYEYLNEPVEINNNIIERNIETDDNQFKNVQIESELEREISILKSIIKEPFSEDEDIKLTEQADRASLYIIILQKINEDNPLKNVDMEEYMNENYEELLYGNDDFSYKKLEYSALAYNKICENNINIMEVLDELNNILVDQINPTDSNYDRYPILSKTLTEKENIYDIYFPFAMQLHLCQCIDEHQMTDGIFECDSIKKEYVKTYSLESEIIFK